MEDFRGYSYDRKPVDQSVAHQSIVGVYGWMFIGLLVTGIVALMVAETSLIYFFANTAVLLFCAILELVITMFFSSRIMKMQYATAVITFLVFSVLNGLTLSIIFLVYTGGVIAFTFLFTAGAFGAMSLYGMVTKNDLTSVGSLCLMGVFGLLFATGVNLFLRSDALYWMISYIGIAVFLGLTAYDTQKMKYYVRSLRGTGKERNIAIFCALDLYLDFINLFLLLLRIFGRRK